MYTQIVKYLIIMSYILLYIKIFNFYNITFKTD